MNGAALTLGVESWKPAFAALALPPAPLLVLVVIGAWLLGRRRRLGWVFVMSGCAALWLSTTAAAGDVLVRHLVQPPAVLAIAREAAAPRPTHDATAVVVLGGGRDGLAPEYAAPSLSASSLERLRYGIWLARRLDLPLAFSGGVGHGAGAGAPEAEIAGRIAAQEFGRPLRWRESSSRDTRENAALTVPLLARDGVRRIILVTHGWHMPRALRAFRAAAARAGPTMDVVPAPMAMASAQDGTLMRWLPSLEGSRLVRLALREWLGRLAGA